MSQESHRNPEEFVLRLHLGDDPEEHGWKQDARAEEKLHEDAFEYLDYLTQDVDRARHKVKTWMRRAVTSHLRRDLRLTDLEAARFVKAWIERSLGHDSE